MSDPTPPPLPPPPPPVPPPPRKPDPSGRVSPEMPAAADAPYGLLGRASDRLNPILVREVHQALNGKAFLLTGCLALLAIILIAMVTAAQQDISPRQGQMTFSIAMLVLCPILFFIVPFQAYLSMSSEVRGGTVEHLLMSRLGPAALVRGKLMAATVQFLIYLAIFSPLIGLTFLLRGIDVAMIATMLTMCFVYALAASALGIACGTLSRWPAIFRLLPAAIMLIGLLWFTAVAMALVGSESWEIRRALVGDQTGRFLAMVLLPPAVFLVLCGMVGSAVLSHPYENRSTRFRLFAIASVLLLTAWIYFDWRSYLFTAGGSLGRIGDLGEILSYASAASALGLFLFAFFACTEPARLSPRVRTRVPRNPVLAALVAPLLPGGGRGMLFTLLLAALSLGLAALLPRMVGAPALSTGSRVEAEYALLAWILVLLYCAVASFVRGFMNESGGRNWIARATLPILLILSSILPIVVNLLTNERGRFQWTPLSAFDPIRTFRAFDRAHTRHDVLPFLIPLAIFLVLLNVPAMVRGVREVLQASAARRAEDARAS